MSAAYTLHVAPYARPGDPDALDRADVVRDAFSWGACLVPMLWFFAHRHLWLGLGALGVVAGLAAALWALGVNPPAIVAAEILLHIMFGLEGSSLRRWAYARRGRPAVDVVTAADAAEAEAKSFARWLAGAAAPTPAAGSMRPAFAAGRGAVSVIGLFPEPDGRR